jgi:hypothetical protein
VQSKGTSGAVVGAYIITTTDHNWPCGCDHGTRLVDRRAVATLDEARAVAFCVMPGGVAEALALPESGGTIGPLPDGTVIEVAPMVWRGAPASSPAEVAAIVDAYNAAAAR